MSRSTKLTTRQINEYLQEEDSSYYFDGRTLRPSDEEFEAFDTCSDLDAEQLHLLDDDDDDDEIADWDADWHSSFCDGESDDGLSSLSEEEALALDSKIAVLTTFEPEVLEALPAGITEEHYVQMYEWRGDSDGLQTGGLWSCCGLMFSYEGINFIAHVVSDSNVYELMESITCGLGGDRLARLRSDADVCIYLVPGFKLAKFARRVCYRTLELMGLASRARVWRGVFPMETVGILSSPFVVRPQANFEKYAELNQRAWVYSRLEELMELQDAGDLDASLLEEFMQLLAWQTAWLREEQSAALQPEVSL